MKDWQPEIGDNDGPRYLAIADAIARDRDAGILAPGSRLPTQRELAKRLGVDFTTVARGYVEAQKRGLVDSHVGRGTYVRAPAPSRPRPAASASAPRRAFAADLSMNMPPEIGDPALLERMREGLAAVSADLVPLLRYQPFGGSPADKEAALVWLRRRGISPPEARLFVTPGAHPALMAVLGMLAGPGETVLSENVTYPGVRSIASQLRLRLAGLPADGDGILPDAFAVACERLSPKALYLNPTLHNPTTLTIPADRRKDICKIAERYRVPIIEDDAYAFVAEHAPPPFAAMLPDLTWHVGGLSKCLGAGLRLAYVVAPDTRAAWPFAGAMRAGSVMASPLTSALTTRWIEDGTADEMLGFLRAEARARQQLVAGLLPGSAYRADPLSFNIWLPLANGWSRSAFIGHMRAFGIGVVASDAFTVDGAPAEAVRVGLGGPIGRDELRAALEFAAHSLEHPPEAASTFF